MNFSLILFLIGILGFVLNRKNIILMLISIEIMLLSITFLILINSLNFDDILGQTFAIYIITVAGAESAIGLGILVAFYRFIFSIISYCRSYNNNTINNHNSYNNTSNGYNNYKNNKRYKNNIYLPYIFNSVSYNTLGVRNYSSNSYSLDPWFITGLLDAEGSFVITILNNSRYKTGWTVQARMQIKMHERDRLLILSIQKFFGGIGYVSKFNNSSTVEFRVSTLKDIVNVVIPHFDKYPLITKKYYDYMLFKQVVLFMLNKVHNTLEGLQKIVNYKASLNLGLSKELKEAFPLTIPIKRSEIEKNVDYKNLSSKWVAGFSTGESNFFIPVQRSKNKSGLSVWLRFSIGQHSRDISLLEGLVVFFGCGYLTNYTQRSVCEFIVTRTDHLADKIIPFFDKHPVIGSKYSNYLYFKSALDIFKNKEHLNPDGKGLKKILQLKSSISKTINKYNHCDSGKEEI
jgi:NADH:ubiquinone oxidoreductase subunit K